jgi:TldD protein
MINVDCAATAAWKARQVYRDFADLFLEHTTVSLCNIVQGELHTAHCKVEQGAAMRRMANDHCVHVHSPHPTEEGLDALIEALEDGEVRIHTSNGEEKEIEAIDFPDLSRQVEVAREAASEVAAMNAGIGADIHLHATIMLRAMQQEVCIVRADGHIQHEKRYNAHLRVEAVAKQKRKVRNGRRGIGAAAVADLAMQNKHRQVARQAAEAALIRLDAIDAPTGEMPVILGPGGPAALVHEVCGHTLEADIAHCSGSAYHGLLGEMIASPLFTLIDDPRVPATMPTYSFDDEGEPAQATVLVDRGRLLTHLYDWRTATAAGRVSNGHARRLLYAYPPLPRMSTTYVVAGETPAAEIIAETERGMYVQSINGGDTSMSGRFNLMVEEGYLIEHGRITAPIRGAVLSGYGPAALQAIDRVGNDCTFFCHGYTCNKLDQFPLSVSLGQPTIRVARLLVWGG